MMMMMMIRMSEYRTASPLSVLSVDRTRQIMEGGEKCDINRAWGGWVKTQIKPASI